MDHWQVGNVLEGVEMATWIILWLFSFAFSFTVTCQGRHVCDNRMKAQHKGSVNDCNVFHFSHIKVLLPRGCSNAIYI